MPLQRTGLGFTLALHALAALGLLSYQPARKVLRDAAPIMVELITPAQLEVKPLEPPAHLPRPRPVAKSAPPPPEPAPALAVPAEASAPATVAAAARDPEPQPVEAAAPTPVTPPVFHADYLDNPAPAYPSLSRRLGEQGKVILRVRVNAAGAADDVQVRDSSGHRRLDEAARDTVRRWKFVPARRGPEPVAAWVLIPISFRLEG